MNKWNLFYPNGEKFEGSNAGKEFVRFYSQIYYYLNRDIKLENEIEKILMSTEVLNENEVTDILRWKTGGKAENGNIITTWHTISVAEVLTIAKDWRINCSFDGSPEDVNKFKNYFNKLNGISGMGPVYTLTILYFISNGKFPIFDRFAFYAITAIYDGMGLDEYVSDITLSTSFDKVFSVYINDYCDKIQIVFEDFGFDRNDIFSNRDIDRALWTYGHLFNRTKTNDVYKTGLKK